MKVYLAIDLGAGSGRLVAGTYESSVLGLEEVHRFENNGVAIQGGNYWNTVQLFAHILEGLKKASAKYGDRIVSIAADTWGCDFALLDSNGNMLGGHRQYRDPRIEGVQEVMNDRISLQDVFGYTGVQPAFYNSSVHLLAERLKENPCLQIADRLLFTPDLLAYWLSGVLSNERTVTSTSQLYDPKKRDWAWDVIDALQLPRAMFGNIVSAGEVLGSLTADVAEQTGASGKVKVVATAGHDTACAVAGLPMEDGGLWLSSGTWSILGVESATANTSKEALAAGLSNEAGVGDTNRLLHNVAGMWMAQESMRHWEEQGEDISFAVLDRLTEEAEPFSAFINPNDPCFAAPGNMPDRICEYCRKTGQTVPQDKGTILRVINESVALKYRQVIEALQQVTGKTYDKLYAGGGGTKNLMLMQAAANAIGIPVVAGPVEATSCGNIITQMVAVGEIADIREGRKLVANSMQTRTFTPASTETWNQIYQEFLNLQ